MMIVAAQYFGQNKVIYDDFVFRVLKTNRFDTYYCEMEERGIHEVARMAEQ